MALGKCRRGQSRQSIKHDEMLSLVPRHQLQRVLRRDYGAVEREEQGGEECTLRQSIEQDYYAGHGTSKSLSIAPPPDVTLPQLFCIVLAFALETIMLNRSVSRRALIETLSLAVAAASLGRQPARGAEALKGEPQKLGVKDPAAVALGYVESAAQVDVKKYPAFVKGSNCENCLQLQGKAGSDYRPCALFPGKLVAVSGWCSSWTPEM